MSKPKYEAHHCKEMEGFIFEFHFIPTKMRQVLYKKPWRDKPKEGVLHFPNFCPFCGKRLLVAHRLYGVPR